MTLLAVLPLLSPFAVVPELLVQVGRFMKHPV